MIQLTHIRLKQSLIAYKFPSNWHSQLTQYLKSCYSKLTYLHSTLALISMHVSLRHTHFFINKLHSQFAYLSKISKRSFLGANSDHLGRFHNQFGLAILHTGVFLTNDFKHPVQQLKKNQREREGEGEGGRGREGEKGEGAGVHVIITTVIKIFMNKAKKTDLFICVVSVRTRPGGGIQLQSFVLRSFLIIISYDTQTQ